jgi:hypothetical protein
VKVSDGFARPKGTALTFNLIEGKKVVRFLNDHSRLTESNYRFRLNGNSKIRARGLRYLSRYEIEFPSRLDLISIDSFDSLDAFESFHYSDSPSSYDRVD